MKFYSYKFFFFIILCSACSFSLSAQRHELGLLLGGSTYQGELNPQLADYRFVDPAAGLFYRYNFSRHYAARIGFNYGSIRGDDHLSGNEFNYNRNLSFRSKMYDFYGQFEFNFLPYQINRKRYRFSPYAFIGIAYFTFNPQAKYKDPLSGEEAWANLHDVNTEGQGNSKYPDSKQYKLGQFAIPFGGGIRWNLWGRLGMGLEVGVRKTFTDYLDDVSRSYVAQSDLSAFSQIFADRSINQDNQAGNPRGNPSNTDWYAFGGLTLYVSLDKSRDPCKPFVISNKFGR